MKTKLYKHILLALTFLVLSAAAFAQGTVTVSGTVTDLRTGESIPGAVVSVKGGTSATTTDIDGRYFIAASPSSTLLVQCLGYVSGESSVGKRTVIDFALETDSEILDETVIVGYGTLKKSQLVGSVETVSGEVLEDRVNTNISKSLQGQIPGLSIIQTDGKPTHGGNIYIRGGATSYVSRGSAGGSKASYSIGQGGSALVLVDGVESDMSTVNPDDVESVTVLKDASSSVIYGARAAYGVILITTKSAKGDKLSISYNGSYSINSRTVKWENEVISDGLTYLETAYEHFEGHDATPGSAGMTPTKLNTYSVPSDYLERFRSHVESGATNTWELVDGQYVYYGNENYLKKFYRPWNGTTTQSLSISGSSGKVSYALSGRYYTQDNIYKIGNEDYNSYNLRSKISVQALDFLSFDSNTSLSVMNYDQPVFSRNSKSVGSQLWQIAMMGLPVIPATNEDGTYTIGGASSGYASFNEGTSEHTDDRMTVTSTTGVTFEPFKDVFKIRGEFTFKDTRREQQRHVGAVSYSSAPGTVTYYVPRTESYMKYWQSDTKRIIANVVATWTPKLGQNHNLNVVGGWNLEDYDYSLHYILRTGLLYPDKANFELMDGLDPELSQNKSSYGLVGFFGRANYTLRNKYILELSARYDGSSKFPASQQWGFFPSASAGWRLSNEPWMKWSRHWLDNLKIRANFGSLGNGAIAPYSFLTTMGVSKTDNVFDGALVPKVSEPSVVPDNLTWETVTTGDVGLDADFLGSRLSFSGDIYVRDTDNLYVQGPEIPATYGASTPKGNYGALRTSGWELTLSWRDTFILAAKDLTYNVKFSLWDSRTKVTKFYNESGGMFNYYEGKYLGEIWGFRTDGLFASNEEASAWPVDTFHNFVPRSGPYAGDLKFVDTNEDGTIGVGSWTLDDHGDLERIGNESPRYQFGLNLGFQWNGIDFSAFFQGVGKRDWYPSQGSDFFWGGYARAYVAYVLKDQAGDNHAILDKSTDNWTLANADKNPYWTRRTYGTANSATGALTFPNDHFLQNAAYVRLKNLTVGYTIPSQITGKARISKARVYLSGENVFTWSPLFRHTSMFDPEVIGNGDSDFTSGTSTSMGDGYSYPMLRTFTLGVNISF